MTDTAILDQYKYGKPAASSQVLRARLLLLA